MNLFIDYTVMVSGFALGLTLGTFVSLIYHVLGAVCNWIRN